MSEKEANILSYAAPQVERDWSYKPEWWMLYCSLMIAGVGGLLLLVYFIWRALHWPGEWIVAAVMVCYLAMGLVATFAFVMIGLFEVISACFYRQRTLGGVAKAVLILIGILLNFPLAIVCVVIGKAL